MNEIDEIFKQLMEIEKFISRSKFCIANELFEYVMKNVVLVDVVEDKVLIENIIEQIEIQKQQVNSWLNNKFENKIQEIKINLKGNYYKKDKKKYEEILEKLNEYNKKGILKIPETGLKIFLQKSFMEIFPIDIDEIVCALKLIAKMQKLSSLIL